MSRRYGQYCGLARALELVGERWGLLVVRDLVLGPKRFTELRAGLPRIPASLLSARLNELEEAGVVRRRILPQLDASVVYELTEYGSELEPVLAHLGLWGARSLTEPAEDDVFTLDSAILALYTTFRPDLASGVQAAFELRFGTELVVHAIVENELLKVSEGHFSDADLVIEVFGPITSLLNGDVGPDRALECGAVAITGDRALLDVFVSVFRIPATPTPAEALGVR